LRIARVLEEHGYRQRTGREFEGPLGKIEFARPSRTLASDPASELEQVLDRGTGAVLATPTQILLTTTFTFNDGSFDGPEKRFEPKGFVRPDSGNAVWGMQFVWPIKAEYRVMYVDPEYRTTIVGRSKRDYLWIMAREPKLPDAELEKLISIAVDAGYDRQAVELVPQKWS
jgi:lipocalin